MGGGVVEDGLQQGERGGVAQAMQVVEEQDDRGRVSGEQDEQVVEDAGGGLFGGQAVGE